MSCNTMYKKILFCGLLILTGIFRLTYALAAEKKEIPEGEILVVYSDGAEDNTLEKVDDIIEILTYQNFKVSYGTASECVTELNKFAYILCYDLKNYSSEFLSSLETYEDTALRQNGQQSGHILFVGNECIREYYDSTGRSGDYVTVNSSVGKIEYSFDGLTAREGMVKEDFFLFLKDISGYKNGSITVNQTRGYFCARDGAITHIPAADMNDNLFLAAFIKEAALWKWPYKGTPFVYAQYIVIDKVYPYQDPAKLLEVVKLFVEQQTPFVLSVMPIYVNGDYPAMEQFCEVLRYAQANGGGIIINAPINQMTVFDKKTVQEYLNMALEVYLGHGVYPLALKVPRNWMFNEDTVDIMRRFKTIFTSEVRDTYIEQTEMSGNLVYKDGHAWVGTAVALDDLGTSYLSVYSSAVPVSMNSEIADIKEIIEACRKSPIPLKSLWDMEHSSWTEKNLMSYKNGNLLLDNKKMDLSYVPGTYDENYNYKRYMLQRFSRDLTSQSRKLIILVAVTSALFVIFIFLARRINRRKYFLKETKSRSKGKKL